jgi:hypothetical protein
MLFWWLVALLSVGLAGYALLYVVLGPRMYAPYFLQSFVARPWGIYPHALFGTIALALGPFQFRRNILRRAWLHRAMGKAYVFSAMLTGLAGLYMSIYSFGGTVTHLGFGGLAVALLVCTAAAFVKIQNREIARHREWMIRSFAMLFSAVTLRIMVPFLAVALGGFEPAYLWVSWLCWVPNLIGAELYVRHTRA